jgi:hypothetical protein
VLHRFEQPCKRDLEGASNGDGFVVHHIPGLAFDSGDCEAVKENSLASRAASQSVLADGQLGPEPALAHPSANHASRLPFASLFHGVRISHA